MIWVDHREKRSGVIEALQRRRVECEVKSLEVGDYVVDHRVVIERKTSGDFLESLKSGRLFAQIAALKRCGRRSAMIIEGLPVVFSGDVNPDAVRGALVSLAIGWQLPVLYTESPEESAWILESVYRQVTKARRPARGTIYFRKKAPDREGRNKAVLQALPLIGPALADQLVRKFGSLEKVFSASEDELRSLKGVGKKRAEELRNVIKEAGSRYLVSD